MLLETLASALYSCIPIICTSLMALFTYWFKDERKNRKEQMKADRNRDKEIQKMLKNQEEMLEAQKKQAEQIKEISEHQIVSIENEMNSITHGTKEVLAYMLTRYFNIYAAQGVITSEQKREWDRIYTIYHNELNGNSTISDLNERIKTFKIDDSYQPINVHVEELKEAIQKKKNNSTRGRKPKQKTDSQE